MQKPSNPTEATGREGCELLTMAEFARRLSISVWTARSWAYRGRIASVKLGARLQVPASEIVRVVAEGMRPRVIQDEERERRPTA